MGEYHQTGGCDPGCGDVCGASDLSGV